MSRMSIFSRLASLGRAWGAPRDEPRRFPIDGRDVSDDTATLDDVHFAYRLFLRRNPDATGAGAYSDQVCRGIKVKDLVSYFVGCPEWIDRRLYKASANTELRRVETAEFPIYVIASDPVVARELIATSAYEPHITARIKDALPSGGVFVDVGANVGFYSLLAAKLVGSTGKVIAFEPNPDNVKVLLLNKLANRLSNVTIYPFAVSNEEGLLSLMKIVSIASTKRVHVDELEHLTDTQVVYSVKLDDIFRDQPRVDLIKCDVDGHDYLAMSGARELIRRTRPAIVAELNPGSLRSFSGVDARAYVDLLLGDGYGVDVLLRSGEIVPCGCDASRVLETLERSGADQVDLWVRRGGAA